MATYPLRLTDMFYSLLIILFIGVVMVATPRYGTARKHNSIAARFGFPILLR